MRHLTRCMILLGATLPSIASAQAGRAVPREVAAWANEQRADCVSSGGRFTGSAAFVRIADFNGDRRPDYVVTRSAFRCSLGVSWGLDGQVPSYEFFVSSGARYPYAGSVSALDSRIVRMGARDVFDVVAGGPGARNRPQRVVYAWNGARMVPVSVAAGRAPPNPAPRVSTRPESAARPAPTSSHGVGVLGIVVGNYVAVNEPCTRPSTVFHYDGRRVGEATRSERWFEPIGRVDRERDGLFLFDHGILLKSLGGGRIQRTVQDTGPVERLCPREQIPPGMRL